MPCENCLAQFSVFKRKRSCADCGRYYCFSCLGREIGRCGACRVLCKRPLGRPALDHLRVRDLQWFLHRQNISTRGCVEKDDLINLVLAHVNSDNYIQRPPPQNSQSDFSHTLASLRGFTSNINNILTSAFDIGSHNGERSQRRNRQQSQPYSQPPNQGFTNSSHVSSGSSHLNENIPPRTVPRPEVRPEQVPAPTASGTTTFASSTDDNNPILVPPQCIVTDTSVENNESPDAPPLQQTTDCVEVEDLDDSADWEFVRRPGDPLPEDSGDLLQDNPHPLRTSARSSSDLDLPSRTSDNSSGGDTASLNETSILFTPNNPPKRIKLDDLKDLSEVESLNIKQLKELLVLNRVDFKGCCERNELLERAKRLWKENTKSREDLEKAASEELCKICMDAPIECVMLECGHIATCISCGKRLSECPICRQYVVRVVRFFRS